MPKVRGILRRFPYPSLCNLTRIRTLLAVAFILGGSLVLMERYATHLERENYQDSLAGMTSMLRISLQQMGIQSDDLTAKEKEKIRPLFNEPLVDGNCYPMLVEPSGRIQFHFFREGDYLPHELMMQMAESPGRSGHFYTYLSKNAKERRDFTYQYSPELECYVAVESNSRGIFSFSAALQSYAMLIFIIGAGLSLAMASWFGHVQRRNFAQIGMRVSELAKGKQPPQMPISPVPDLAKVAKNVNELIDGLLRTAEFARSIGQSKLDTKFEPLSPQDILGNSLLDMQNNLKHAAEVESVRKEEDKIRNWINQGTAEFSQLLREHANESSDLAFCIVEKIATFVNVSQVGLFEYIIEDEESFLELKAAFAYDRKKYLNHRYKLGEGLVGTCGIERDLIHLDQIPEGYCSIYSGIGQASPHELLLVPLIADDNLLGVIEVASLRQLEPHEVNFVQSISGSIAQSLLTANNAQHTAKLLRESQAQREKLHSQEEEMHQTLEEIQATQEDMRKQMRTAQSLRRIIDLGFFYVELTLDGLCTFINRAMERAFSLAGVPSPIGKNLVQITYAIPELGSEGVPLEQIWQSIIQQDHYLTVLHWHTPSGFAIEARGVVSISKGDKDDEDDKVIFIGQRLTHLEESQPMMEGHRENQPITNAPFGHFRGRAETSTNSHA